MAEVFIGLAAASSIITVIDLTGKLLRVGWDCVKIYRGNAPEGMERLVEELTLLHGLLTTLRSQFELAKKEMNIVELAVEKLLQQKGGLMEVCKATLNEVATTLNNILSQRGARLKTALTGHNISKQLIELVNRIERFKSCLLIALHSDHITVAQVIHSQLTLNLNTLGTEQGGLKIAIEDIDGKVDNLLVETRKKRDAEYLMRQEKRARKALCWLNAPDYKANHTNARQLAQHGTGVWFTQGPVFTEWLAKPYGSLWLHATPGAGKTILCSTTIESAIANHAKEPDTVVCYFYFDFRDPEKQTTLGFLSAILHQLCVNLPSVPDELLGIYDKYKGEKVRPSPAELCRHLILVIRRYHRKVYVFMDALDECREWDVLLPILKELMASRSLALLATSRQEQHIMQGLADVAVEKATIDARAVAMDVELFVTNQIAAEPHLRDLAPGLKNDIVSSLVKGANGMFRWVKCQFDAIKSLRRPKAIRKALGDLPDTLDETYERILVSVRSSEERSLLRRVLCLIIYAARPMTLAEVAEAAVIEEGASCLDPEDRFTSPEDLFVGCRNLIISTGGYLGLSHYSVQEYLKSDRIAQGPAVYFAIGDDEAFAELSKICLTYLGYDDFDQGPRCNDHDLDARLSDYPFLDYAANNWYKHAASESAQTVCLPHFTRLWSNRQSPKWLSWLQVFCDQSVSIQRKFDTYRVTDPSLIYFPSLWGLKIFTEHLLSTGHCPNQKGGYFSFPLQAATVGKHRCVVELLIENGAIIDAMGGYHGTALQAAANCGSLEIATLLLSRGADPMLSGGAYGNALQSAARNGHFAIAEALIRHGVDVNLAGGPFGFALQAAANNGHWEIIQLLLTNGADINSQGGAFGNALQAASLNGWTKAVEVLLENGADANFQGGLYSNALFAAALNGHEDVVQLLIDAGADVNTQNGLYANALQAAAINGHDDVVGILLKAGADVHVKGGMAGYALSAAARNGYLKVVAQLLEYKPQLDVDEGYYGSPLQAAARNGFTSVVKILLEHGASANTPGGSYGNPLQAAASNGKGDIVALLLQHGADVNQVGGRYHTAVIAAAAFGHKDVIKQLLDAKADPFANGSKFGTAVQAAKVNGRDDVALLLEEHIKSIQVATLPSTRSCEPAVKMPMKLTFTVKL